MASDIGWIAAAMLVVFNGIVFSAVQFAFRVMGMADRDEGPRGGRGVREPVLIPVPVRCATAAAEAPISSKKSVRSFRKLRIPACWVAGPQQP